MDRTDATHSHWLSYYRANCDEFRKVRGLRPGHSDIEEVHTEAEA